MKLTKMYKYFNINEKTTAGDLKKQYRSWALKLHPDAGGSEVEFKELKMEHEQAIAELKARYSNEGDSAKLDELEKYSAAAGFIFDELDIKIPVAYIPAAKLIGGMFLKGFADALKSKKIIKK